jgi:hypothetical protein
MSDNGAISDGGLSDSKATGAAVQAKPCVNTGAVALAHPTSRHGIEVVPGMFVLEKESER